MSISPQHGKKTILLVDDASESRILAKWFLSTFDYVVHSAANAEDALARFDPTVHSLVLTDNSMPGMSGREMASIIKQRSPATPIIMFTGNPPVNLNCVDLVIQKPAHLLNVKHAIDRFIGTT